MYRSPNRREARRGAGTGLSASADALPSAKTDELKRKQAVGLTRQEVSVI